VPSRRRLVLRAQVEHRAAAVTVPSRLGLAVPMPTVPARAVMPS
jgi:hypothetical protein